MTPAEIILIVSTGVNLILTAIQIWADYSHNTRDGHDYIRTSSCCSVVTTVEDGHCSPPVKDKQ